MTGSIRTVVIIGGGQAGYEAAMSLRQGGYEGAITIVADEPHLPYQRPPLSKTLLADSALLTLATSADLAAQRITFLGGTRAEAIDRTARRVTVSSDAPLAYDRLVLATGARNRSLDWPPLEGVCGIRTIADAESLRNRLAGASRMVVVGGGFLGLEVACMAAARGVEVNVVEATATPMGRAVSAATADAMVRRHAARGIAIHRNARIARVLAASGRIAGVCLEDGRRLPADLAVISIGVIPNVDLAASCGIVTGNGILVDGTLRTADPTIFAIGDCAAFPGPSQGRLRLESVQNAIDQGRHVARAMLGHGGGYDALSWFWSEQGGMRLQIAGLSAGHDETITIGSIEDGLTTFCFRERRLVCVETIDRPAVHMAARRGLASGRIPDREAFDDPSFDFRDWVRRA